MYRRVLRVPMRLVHTARDVEIELTESRAAIQAHQWRINALEARDHVSNARAGAADARVAALKVRLDALAARLASLEQTIRRN